MEWWTAVTEPQATIIAALLTVIAALTGVLLGSWLFSGKVSDLKAALTEAEKHLEQYRGQVEVAVREIGSTLDVQVQAIQQSLGNISTSVNDLRESGAVEEAAPIAGGEPPQADLRECWTRIRDRLEEIAAGPQIDGRTRAKYTRIDRRRYSEFIGALARDGQLGANEQQYWDALEIWNRNRNGRREPSPQDVQRMRDIAGTVAV